MKLIVSCSPEIFPLHQPPVRLLFLWFIFPILPPLSFLFISSPWISPIIFYSCVNITAMREYKEWKSHTEIRSHWVILTCCLSLSRSVTAFHPPSPALSFTLSLLPSLPRLLLPSLFPRSLPCCLSLVFAVC